MLDEKLGLNKSQVKNEYNYRIEMEWINAAFIQVCMR